MDIETIANNLNIYSEKYKIGKLQEIRKKIKGLKRSHTSKIFSSVTIFNDKYYAFHDGGRTEIQYNIGIEEVEEHDWLRYGLAFSLEPGQTIPDVSVLYPQILQFNILFRTNPALFKDYKMWACTLDGRTDIDPIHEIYSSLIQPHNFIFFGKLMDLSNINYNEILVTFDNMLLIYENILINNDNINIENKNISISKLKFIKTNVKLPQERKYTREQMAVDIDIRHSKIQEFLVKKLIEKYGNKNVSLEHPIFGNKIDVVVNDNRGLYFYEIKTALTARDCIRQAMGQILDYGFWPGQQNAVKLFIVGEAIIDKNTEKYLQYLNDQFRLSLDYIRIKI
jgi:hypothetical protein